MVMTKLQYQFDEFIQSFLDKDLSKAEIKFLYLLKMEIPQLSRFRGKSLIEKLLISVEKNWDDLPDQIEPPSITKTLPIRKLHSLEIQNFRGFINQEHFSFEKPYTFIYGPNGCGKSSLCEALEYSLLGYISESDFKQIPVDKYIINLITNLGEKPRLLGVDFEGNKVELKPAPNFYYFCFIEKNRLDSFSRISVLSRQKNANLLVTLFGLEEFLTFVDQFHSEIEVFTKEEEKMLFELENKQQDYLIIKNLLDEGEFEEQNNREKDLLVKKSGLNMEYEELDVYLHGSEMQPGALANVERKLNEISNQIIGDFEFSLFESYIESFHKFFASLGSAEFSYQEQNQLFSLYAIITETKATLDNTAAIGDKKELLNTLQESISQIKLQLEDFNQKHQIPLNKQEMNQIILQLKPLNKLLYQLNQLLDQQMYPMRFPLFDEWSLSGQTHYSLPKIKKLIDYYKQNEDDYFEFKQRLINRSRSKLPVNFNELKKEYEHLSGLSAEMKRINTDEEKYLFQVTKIKQSEIELQNEKKRMEHIKNDQASYQRKKEFFDAYQTVLRKMKNYVNQLPVLLSQDLNELTKIFYNEINRNDESCELFERVVLPASNEDKIKIFFKDEPLKPYDALHILSEGHVRCLGLAILLAKCVQDRLDFIILDDIINAIDDDHRGGIREVLFNHPLLKEKQIILTSHAEEFIKDLDNQFFIKDYKKLVNRINLLPYKEKRGVNVKRAESSYNYLQKAENSLANYDKREALRNCRSALENIIDTLWVKMSKKYSVAITVKIPHPNAAPTLISKVQGLTKYIKKEMNDVESFNEITDNLEYLIGIGKANNLIWSYLNKGTHEESERKEFDIHIVRSIFEKLTDLDERVKNLKL